MMGRRWLIPEEWRLSSIKQLCMTTTMSNCLVVQDQEETEGKKEHGLYVVFSVVHWSSDSKKQAKRSIRSVVMLTARLPFIARDISNHVHAKPLWCKVQISPNRHIMCILGTQAGYFTKHLKWIKSKCGIYLLYLYLTFDITHLIQVSLVQITWKNKRIWGSLTWNCAWRTTGVKNSIWRKAQISTTF